jgi:hypothetical protein
MTRRTAAGWETIAPRVRVLVRDEMPLVWTVDRREIVHRLYALRDGARHPVLAFYDVRGRADGEGDHDTAILLDCHDRGGWLRECWTMRGWSRRSPSIRGHSERDTTSGG